MAETGDRTKERSEGYVVGRSPAWTGRGGDAGAAQADRRDRFLASVELELARYAEIRLGERVLDIGCGCGASALAAAVATGGHGHVSGLDVSEQMINVAKMRAVGAGVEHVDFRVCDVQTVELGASYDAAISRFGTMFFEHAPAAFANIASALKPGGRLCMVTWQAFRDNEWLTILADSVLGSTHELDDDGPGMFAQSNGEVIRSILTGAGFVDTVIIPRQVSLWLGDHANDAVDFLLGLTINQEIVDKVDPGRRQAVIEHLRNRLATCVERDGVRLEGAILVTTANTKSTS